MQGNAKGTPTEQPNAQKHPQPANVRPISKQKRRETLKEPLQSNPKRKTFTTSQRAANQLAKRHGNHKGVPIENPKAKKQAQTANVRPINKQ